MISKFRNIKTEYFYLGIILAFGTFLRLLISDFNMLNLDFDHFYHARMGRVIFETRQIPVWDYQEGGGNRYFYTPLYHILIAFGKYLFPSLDYIEIGARITFFTAPVSMFFLYFLAKREFGRKVALLSLIIFSSVPIIVLRTGLWARPTGLSIMFAIILFYILLSQKKTMQRIPLFMATILYGLAHSSILFILPVGIIVSAVKFRRIPLDSLAASIAAGFFLLLYYYPILPFLNFTAGFTYEYMPLIARDLNFDLITISYYNFYLPLILLGLWIGLKKKEKYGSYLQILVLLILILPLVKKNLFILTIFIESIVLAIVLFELKKYKLKYREIGWALFYPILILIITANLLLIINTQVVNIEEKEVLKNALLGNEFNRDDMILPNYFPMGHEIAYYTPSQVFITDLTDSKKWSENVKVLDSLLNEKDSDNAYGILKEKEIDYIIVNNKITHTNLEKWQFPFLFNQDPRIELIYNSSGVLIYKII